MYLSSLSEYMVSSRPFHSPPFMIICCCPGLLSSKVCVPENAVHPATLWSSWLSFLVEVFYGTGEYFDGHLEGIVCWCAFWHASDMFCLQWPPVCLIDVSFWKLISCSQNLTTRYRGCCVSTKACNRLLSTLRMVYESAPWRWVDCTQDVYIFSFIDRLR